MMTTPKASHLRRKSWQQETVLRSLPNQLDPQVAEALDQLIGYGGVERTMRNWESLQVQLMARKFRSLENGPSRLLRSGNPSPVFPPCKALPRVLNQNPGLDVVPHANADYVWIVITARENSIQIPIRPKRLSASRVHRCRTRIITTPRRK